MNVIDLYCGLGGWAKGFVEKGDNVTGYDIIDFSEKYLGKFVKADLLTSSNFPSVDIIVASPPCTDFSKASFPPSWKSVQRYPPDIPKALQLFNRVYEIVEMVKPKYYIIENVRGAEKYVGKARMHIGSRYFWGNFPLFSVGDADDIAVRAICIVHQGGGHDDIIGCQEISMISDYYLNGTSSRWVNHEDIGNFEVDE